MVLSRCLTKEESFWNFALALFSTCCGIFHMILILLGFLMKSLIPHCWGSSRVFDAKPPTKTPGPPVCGDGKRRGELWSLKLWGSPLFHPFLSLLFISFKKISITIVTKPCFLCWNHERLFPTATNSPPRNLPRCTRPQEHELRQPFGGEVLKRPTEVVTWNLRSHRSPSSQYLSRKILGKHLCSKKLGS